jgi:hypothetical protein
MARRTQRRPVCPWIVAAAEPQRATMVRLQPAAELGELALVEAAPLAAVARQAEDFAAELRGRPS